MRKMLTCHDVYKSYGGVSVLRGVTLDVRAGEILGLIGANGAGKSTLIDIISGLTPATSGEIRIAGAPILQASAASRAQSGMARTFQHPQVAGELTLRQNILAACGAQRLSTPGGVLSAFLSGFVDIFVERDDEADAICASLGLRDPERRLDPAYARAAVHPIDGQGEIAHGRTVIPPRGMSSRTHWGRKREPLQLLATQESDPSQGRPARVMTSTMRSRPSQRCAASRTRATSRAR